MSESDADIVKRCLAGETRAFAVLVERYQKPVYNAALQILKDGGEVDYVGATAVELIGGGESAGNYRQYEIKDGKITTVKYR